MHAWSIIVIENSFVFRSHYALCHVLEDDMRTSNTMSTGFSTIMQSIDLDVACKGQVDLKLFLAEDSIPAVFSLASSLFLFVLSCRGWTEPRLFLVFGYHYDQGKWGLRFRIKAHSGLMAITLEISSRSSIGSTDSSHPHDKMKFLVSSAFFFTLSSILLYYK